MSGFWIGFLVGFGASVMANFIYDITAAAIGNCLIRHRITFKVTGHTYHCVFTDVCGTVLVSKTKWGWLIKRGAIPLSVRLTFKPSDGQNIKTLARWKMDMDESTTTSVKLGSIRECILVTLHGNQIYPGSEDVVQQPMQGDWDMDVKIIDGDTQEIYLSTLIKKIVIDGKLTILNEKSKCMVN